MRNNLFIFLKKLSPFFVIVQEGQETFSTGKLDMADDIFRIRKLSKKLTRVTN